MLFDPSSFTYKHFKEVFKIFFKTQLKIFFVKFIFCDLYTYLAQQRIIDVIDERNQNCIKINTYYLNGVSASSDGDFFKKKKKIITGSFSCYK